MTTLSKDLLLTIEICFGHRTGDRLHQRHQRLLGWRPVDEPVSHLQMPHWVFRRSEAAGGRSGAISVD